MIAKNVLQSVLSKQSNCKGISVISSCKMQKEKKVDKRCTQETEKGEGRKAPQVHLI